MTGYALAGMAVVLIVVLLGRFAVRETAPEPTPARTELSEPEPRQTARPVAATDELPAETAASEPPDSAVTNAAVLYRQAFALYDALSQEEKGLLGDWRTNVDASVEAQLCEKLRPILERMHQAATVTNCDWGIEPMTFGTRFDFLAPARACARAAAWSAARCRSRDATGATDDVLSALRLGQSVSQVALIGCLVDFAIQGLAFSSVAWNLGSFGSADRHRLVAAITDPAYEQAPARAIEQEANMVARLGDHLVSLPPDEFQKEMAEFAEWMLPPPKIDQASARQALLEIAELERELGKILAAGSAEEYEAWLRKFDQIQESNSLVELLLPPLEAFVSRVQRAEVARAMVVTALGVAETGTEALAAHPDPATGEPFIYTETADGFELQSGYQTNGIPLKMQFR